MIPMLLLAALTAPASAAAPDADDEEQAAPQTEIVVTGRALDAARARIEPALGASTYTLTNDTIENRPGGETRDLGSILVQVPGVRRDGNGSLVVRGTPGDVEYRLNNIILPGGSEFGESFSARLADKTELITGALPAQYGLSAGGVVNVTTKNGLYQSGGGQAELYGGSHRTIEPAFEGSAAWGGTSLFASGSYRRSDLGLALPSTAGGPRHDRSRELEGFVFADHVIDPQSRFSLILGTSNESNEIPGLAAPGIPGSANRHGDQNTHHHYAIVAYQRTDGPLNVQVALSGLLGRVAISPDRPTSIAVDGVALDLHQSRRTAGAQIEAAYTIGDRHILRGGLIASTQLEQRDQQLADRGGTSLSNAVERRNSVSLFIQDEWQMTPRLTANAGLRGDRVSGIAQGSALGPRASLTWAGPGGLSAHASYARYFVAPPLDDAIATTNKPSGERDDYFDLGVEWKLGNLTLGADAYRRAADNLIARLYSPFAPVAQTFNYRSGRLAGVELLMTYADGPLRAWGNVALSRSTARGIATGANLFAPAVTAFVDRHWIRIDQDQELTCSGGLSYRFGSLLLSSDVLVGSGGRRSPLTGDPNGARLPGHVTLDLAAVYRLHLIEDRPLDIRLDLTNVSDRRYALSDGTGLAGGAPQYAVGRGIFVGIEQGF